MHIHRLNINSCNNYNNHCFFFTNLYLNKNLRYSKYKFPDSQYDKKILTKNELQAIDEYINCSEEFNVRLYYINKEKLPEIFNNRLINLTSALKKLLQLNGAYPSDVQKGIKICIYEDNNKNCKSFFYIPSNFTIGSIFETKTFISTTSSSLINSCFLSTKKYVWKISNIKTGVQISHLAGIKEDEKEILFPIGTKFKILAIKKELINTNDLGKIPAVVVYMEELARE